MTEQQQILLNKVEKQTEMILKAERWLWAHPQTGFTEWQAHQYLAERFEELGYQLVLAGNIPGFYTDVDTGKPGPKCCFMAEMDALDIPGHPEAVEGIAHLCGHHGQCAALLGLAAALKEPGVLEGLSGSIRLMLVPAEELTQIGFREEMREKGIIKYFGGKTEFMARGYFDDVDMSLMVHQGGGTSTVFDAWHGCNGCISKKFIYKGKTAHAGANPQNGINAQYAAMLGMQACNDLRETFRDNDHIRFHPVSRGGNGAVNNIPDEIQLESYVRGKTLQAIKRENRKINRALTGAALAMGARVELHDRPGYAPTNLDTNFLKLAEKCCVDMVGAEKVKFKYGSWAYGSTDFGDVASVMPCALFNVCGGFTGSAHAVDYRVTDPYRLCVDAAKIQLLVIETLLKEDALAAKEIIAQFVPEFSSIQECLESTDEIFLDKEAVVYDDEGRATVEFF